jgi:hypothetical protein
MEDVMLYNEIIFFFIISVNGESSSRFLNLQNPIFNMLLLKSV